MKQTICTSFCFLFLCLFFVGLDATYKNGITLALNQKGLVALSDVVTVMVKERISSLCPVSLDIGFYESFVNGNLQVNVTRIVIDELEFRGVEMSLLSHTGIEIVLKEVTASVTWYLWYDALDILEDTTLGKGKVDDMTVTLNLVLSDDHGRLDVDVDSIIHVGGIELELVDLPEIVKDVLDGVLVTVINTQLSSALDPIINENVQAELVKLWTGFVYINTQNTTVLDYNLSAPIFIGENFMNVYFTGDIHLVGERTCEYEYVPHPGIIVPTEEFEIQVDYWMSDCGLDYLHKNGLFSDLINDQLKQLLRLDKRLDLLIELSSRPLLQFEGEEIHIGIPLNPQFYKESDKWLSILADITLNVDPILIPGKNYTVNITGSLGNVSFGCDYVNPGVAEVFKEQIRNADWNEYEVKLKDFIKTTFGESLSQTIVLPSMINDFANKIGLQHLHIKENKGGSGFIIELDIDE
eukprot:TRINITY_DN12964_c0_g1_i1.p1 TRINITY_DN12964_c0_g1~~TRINITY_DN12964_c0_g1_i1.p1  ORF type:complete len:467 (+),score=101.15 TRINITY_DN12964_c0_g1_i1:2-1402(+)